MIENNRTLAIKCGLYLGFKMSNSVTKDNLTVSFSTDWFTHNIPSLSYILNNFTPKRILEIGSFEGRSTHFFTEEMLKYHNEIEIHCIDSWEGGLEHQGKWDMGSIEQSLMRIFKH